MRLLSTGFLLQIEAMDTDLIWSRTMLIHLCNNIYPVFTPKLCRGLPYPIRLWAPAPRIDHPLSLLSSYNNLLLTTNSFIAFSSLSCLLFLPCHHLLISFPSFRLESPGPHGVLECRESLKEPLYGAMSLETLPFPLHLANLSLMLQLGLQYKSNFAESTKS